MLKEYESLITATVFVDPHFSLHAHSCLGKTSLQRVCDCFSRCSVREGGLDSIDQLLQNSEGDWRLVVGEDFPLLTAEGLDSVMEYALLTGEDCIRFEGGILFRPEKLARAATLKEILFKTFDGLQSVRLTPETLSFVCERFRKQILKGHAKNGVLIPYPETVFVDCHTRIGAETYVGPGVILEESVIGDCCKIGSGSTLKSAVVGDYAEITSSLIDHASVGEGSKVGPFAYLRPDSKVGENCRIGDFVELKNAEIGRGCKISHLAYVGDAVMGQNCNIGCGAVFANYNGKQKSRTVLGDKVFVGSNCNLVAPLSIGDGSFLAAGTTVTEDVPPFSLCIGRTHQLLKENWTKRYFGENGDR